MNYLDNLASEIRAAVPPKDLPDKDTRDLFRLYALLLLAKGETVDAADVHNAWCAWTANQDPDHESLIPFADLSDSMISQDAPYVEAIHSVAQNRASRLSSP